MFDVYSTNIIIINGGEERNYLMRSFMNLVGVLPAMIIFKLVFLGIWGFVVFDPKLKNIESIFSFSLLLLCDIVYIHFMYFHNFQIIKIINS